VNLTEKLREAYKAAGMDENGMLPEGLRCKQCGKVLDEGGMRPAERYAGTYTGLCDACTRAPAFVIEEDPTDGARRWSYPPQCPSWRREREEVVAYADCPTCKGTGRVRETVYGWRGHWDSIMTQCDDCSKRYWNAEHRRPKLVGHETKEQTVPVAPGVVAVKIVKLDVYERLGQRYSETADVRFEVRLHGRTARRYRTYDGLCRYLQCNGWLPAKAQ